MKALKKYIVPLVTVGLLGSVVVNFSGCSKDSPFQSGERSQEISKLSLAKKPADKVNPGKGNKNKYPQLGRTWIEFNNGLNAYKNGHIILDSGSKFTIESGSLTPPPGTAWGSKIPVNMKAFYSKGKDELIFQFGPSECKFDPPAEIKLDWRDLNIEKPVLYYLCSDGSRIQQTPDQICLENKWLIIKVDHFSRYALGTE